MADAVSWDDTLDPVGITSEAVAMKRQPVRRVLHEGEHGGWHFYDGVEPLKGPVALPKPVILKLDLPLKAIKDLPVGWQAKRKDLTSPWVRAKVSQ